MAKKAKKAVKKSAVFKAKPVTKETKKAAKKSAKKKAAATKWSA